jgi:hypothetical protein
MASALILNACGGASVIEIPASLKAPCVSTVDVSAAQTVGDLGRAIVQSDGDLRVCDARREAVVTIAEAGKKRFLGLF